MEVFYKFVMSYQLIASLFSLIILLTTELNSCILFERLERPDVREEKLR